MAAIVGDVSLTGGKDAPQQILVKATVSQNLCTVCDLQTEITKAFCSARHLHI
jgi:hypothetical protein